MVQKCEDLTGWSLSWKSGKTQEISEKKEKSGNLLEHKNKLLEHKSFTIP